MIHVYRTEGSMTFKWDPGLL